MRPSLRFAKTKKINTPGGRVSYHKIAKTSKDVCGVCGTDLLGKRRDRAHGNLCSVCSREILKLKVKTYVQ